MRILLVMDPGILVPPQGYGGIERIVEIMAKEYVAMGHEVHLLVTTGSQVDGCTIHPFGREVFPQDFKDTLKAVPYAWYFIWKHRNYFDLVHNFGRLAYLLPVMHHPIKKIMTYQREIRTRNIKLTRLFGARNMFFTACSADLMSRLTKLVGQWDAVYNAINFDTYSLSENLPPDAPLIFLGRIEKVKGCHTAIALAKATGEQLIIAGNISTLPEEVAYFEKEIKPHIDDKQIKYVGVLNDQQKNEWLGKSKAMVFPIEWNEPFGIVMIEAMACGTPVIGYERGSVDEVIDEGITGFKVNSFDEMAAAVKKLSSINRAACRRKAAERFDAPVIAAHYLNLFNQPEGKRIVIVTTGQPATNPRVMKEYESLKNAGYAVKVLYTFSAEWALKIDKQKFAKGLLRNADFIMIGGDPIAEKKQFFISRALFKIFKILYRFLPLGFVRDMAVNRASFYLWLHSSKFEADLYIAHYVGALPGAARAARKHHAPLVFDAEDYHRGEPVYYPEQVKHIIEVENQYLPKAAHITTASPLISKQYQRLYPGQQVTTLNNVFSRHFLQAPTTKKETPLTLFWFSQNIGPNRGLEIIIDAINLLDKRVDLYLLGNAKSQPYIQSLMQRARYPDEIHLITPVDPDKIFEVAAGYDVGLASELPLCENRNICLTNKIFTYLLAGNCILASNTAAQAGLMNSYPGIGLQYQYDDAADLASQISKLLNDASLLAGFRNNAYQVAAEQLNWENEQEKLLAIVRELLPAQSLN